MATMAVDFSEGTLLAMDSGICEIAHPKTGDTCTKLSGHDHETNDPMTRQHVAANGVKWPHLAVLDPSEGFNGPLPWRI